MHHAFSVYYTLYKAVNSDDIHGTAATAFAKLMVLSISTCAASDVDIHAKRKCTAVFLWCQYHLNGVEYKMFKLAYYRDKQYSQSISIVCLN